MNGADNPNANRMAGFGKGKNYMKAGNDKGGVNVADILPKDPYAQSNNDRTAKWIKESEEKHKQRQAQIAAEQEQFVPESFKKSGAMNLDIKGNKSQAAQKTWLDNNSKLGSGAKQPQQPQPQPQPQTKPLSQSKPAAAARPNPRKGPKAKTREYDHLFKLVLIGDATVGKTSLLLRFADDSFKDNYISTIGVDFRFRTLTIDNDLVKLQIWDTAGQERFRTITSAYYRGSDGVILIYDITNMESFEHVRDWLEDVHKVTGTTIPKLIVGNKSDLQHMRQVNVMQAQQFAMSAGASMIETSAKTADNVDKSFALIAKELVKRGKVTRKSISLHTADEDDDDDDTKKSCCSLV
mmetsp:Transcript_14358/g.22446  ORF Transcript_14358/g.22446 Transcript_14358/m.22446 type:complete len:352 (-) Transcript_14358:187-1242(-)